MIKINLLAEARAEKVARPPLVSLGTGSINNYIVLALLFVAIGYVGITYWKLSSTLSRLKAEVNEANREFERLKPIIAEVELFKKKNADLKRKIEIIEKLKADQYGPVRIMDEVSKALPDLLWLTNMDLKDTTLTIRGQAFNENAVANFIANLAGSPFFQEPSLQIMQQDRANLFSFSLTCNFTYAPAAPKPAGRQG